MYLLYILGVPLPHALQIEHLMYSNNIIHSIGRSRISILNHGNVIKEKVIKKESRKCGQDVATRDDIKNLVVFEIGDWRRDRW